MNEKIDFSITTQYNDKTEIDIENCSVDSSLVTLSIYNSDKEDAFSFAYLTPKEAKKLAENLITAANQIERKEAEKS